MTNHHQSKSNSIKMHHLLIITLLICVTVPTAVLCVPNNQQQQQQQRTTTLGSNNNYDKQQQPSNRKHSINDELQQSRSFSSESSTSATINFQCPEQFGYYTDARDCTKYYVCVFGEVLHESCTGGLRFSRELQTCDWPRNVDCPSQPNGTIGQSTNLSPSSSTTTPYATTTLPSTSSNGASRQVKELSVASAEAAAAEERTLKGSSMVFADEGSDPQQPSFDEAVSPVITADGAIHLHDGSGGTFSLQPNHHPQAAQQQQQQSHHQVAQNVDVFVKPLQVGSSIAQAQQANNQGSQQSRARPSQQQQSGRASQLQQVAPAAKPLQPAVLPEQRVGSHKPVNQQANNNQHHHQHNNQQQQQQPQLQSVNQFNAATSTDSNNNESASDSELLDELPPPNDSVGAQADQEASDQEGESESESQQDGSGMETAEQPAGNRQQQPQPGYIPPVMAPNTLRQANQHAPTNVGSLGGQRGSRNSQSSPLLSINNRQVVDSRQSSFKPIHFSTPVAPIASTMHRTSNPDNSHDNSFRDNQRSAQPSLDMANNNNAAASATEEDEEEDDSNNSGSNNQPPQGLQQEPAKRATTPSRQMRQNQTLLHNNNNNNNALIGSTGNQNNRQSRMSSSFQSQQFVPAINQLPATGGSRPSAASNSQRQQLMLDQQQTMSNNVNFNESSKLIRLQASQFEQPSLLMNSNSNNNNGPHNGAGDGASTSFPRFPSSNSLPTAISSSSSSRSQNVLFSQQPFGLIAETNGNNHHQLDGRNNGNLPPLRHPLGSTSLTANIGNNNNNNPAFLQQQRRPRPPNRQQIPVGPTSVRPLRQQAGSGRQLVDVDSSTTPTITSTNQPATTPNSFLSPHDTAFMEPEGAGDPTGSTPPATTLRADIRESGNSQFGGQPTAALRQLVAPTTVNFQQDGSFSSAPSPTTSFATTPSVLSSATTRRLQQPAAIDASQLPARLNSNNNLRHQQQQQHHQTTNNKREGQQQQRSQQLSTNQPSETPPGLTIATTTATTTTTTNSNLQGANSNPTATNNQAADSGPATATAVADQQDPQFVANRYLNSAIDALEAGQPFGTVDYDFDILNDNSTDRRNPSGPAGVQPTTQSANNQTTLFNSNNDNPTNNANRQRQFSNGGQQTDDDGENISLTNGQPNGSQIGLNSRPQQASSGRARANGLQVNGQPANSRQQQQQFGQSGDSSSSSFAPNSDNSPAVPLQSATSGQQQNSPTKKPRPTNKKITVNHEQALANIRASIEPARRPEALFATPSALQTATKCDTRACRLPDCKCGDTLNPGGLDAKVIPQVILLTFDDAVNDLNWEIYEELFTGRTNPNGCPVLATFYVSHEWTDYGQVQTLYSRGHEMASHSVTHSFGEKFSKSQWFKEINGQREILNMYGGVKMNDVRGMRAPFLQIGGNKMFEMLYDANFTYDSSMPIFENSPPLWPYTLDYQLNHECMITPCPTKSFPGVWEVGMTMWVDLRGGRCSMGDACSNPPDEDGVYEMLMKNFNRHYKSNRAPFGLFYHSAWFNTVHHRRGFLRFMGTVNSLSDVFFVTNWQMLQWMRKPTPLSEINSFEPWQCPAKNDRPPPCFHPSVCNVKSEHGTRFMKTCQPCPANQQYPWVGATGFKGKQNGQPSGSG